MTHRPYGPPTNDAPRDRAWGRAEMTLAEQRAAIKAMKAGLATKIRIICGWSATDDEISGLWRDMQSRLCGVVFQSHACRRQSSEEARMTPYSEGELLNLITAFEETLTTLVTPALIEEKKRDIAELRAMHAEMMAGKDALK